MFIFRSKDGKTFVGGISERHIDDFSFMSIRISFPFVRLIFFEKNLKLRTEMLVSLVDISLDVSYDDLEVSFSKKNAYIGGYAFKIKASDGEIFRAFSTFSRKEAREILKAKMLK